MPDISSQPPDSSPRRPPIDIHELEGLTILRARLIIDADGKDALLLDGDDGTSVTVNLRQKGRSKAFLEVSGENVLMPGED
ncbi:hypothetical protein VVD49_19820 [Uliginosibacterium sp. H3]|uniref:Uncharacterized protein n=1 Tax=Uliginosibacterium silvisoli TaxID=3114758 RepID=A0ABU6KAL5_9RHOO|nr:hypothetical protein [Uliginosibacterium sp. H3]